MASKQVILFLLVDYSEPKFVGLAWKHEFQQVIMDHRRTKPPFMVQILAEYDSLYAAQAAARPLIKRYLTNMFGWNKTDYGDLDNKPFSAKGIVGWGARYNIRAEPRFDALRRKRSEITRMVAHRDNHVARLPYLAGETHPNKREENREKIKKAAQGRRRYYFEDGSWTWQYASDHPLAYKNRDNGIPPLKEEKAA